MASRSKACGSFIAILPRACADGKDIEARAQMLAAASMGATAFQKGLGGVHAIAHPVGSWFNTHHGLTNAVILPYVMTFNRHAIADKADIIARVLDLPARGFDGFLAWVLEMRRELGIPHSLADIGVSADKAAIIGSEAASIHRPAAIRSRSMPHSWSIFSARPWTVRLEAVSGALR